MAKAFRPPIQYLQGFAAAARLNSFKLAAEQLNVTPSAISQQIKSLEASLGLVLFNRAKRELSLTLAGRRFFKVAENTLKQYERELAEFAREYVSSPLKISMISYMANEIVIPHLHEFQQMHPGISLSIESSNTLEDLQSRDLDAAIRFGTPPWPGLQAELICSVYSGLLASDEYLRKNPIRKRQDWENQTLIHSRSHVNDWQRWMADTGNVFEPKNELLLDSYDAALRAAEEGLGIVIAALPLSQHRLDSKHLSLLFKANKPLAEGLYLVSRGEVAQQEKVQAVLSWIKGLLANP